MSFQIDAQQGNAANTNDEYDYVLDLMRWIQRWPALRTASLGSAACEAAVREYKFAIPRPEIRSSRPPRSPETRPSAQLSEARRRIDEFSFRASALVNDALLRQIRSEVDKPGKSLNAQQAAALIGRE